MKKLVLNEDILEKVKDKPFVLAEMATHLKVSTAYLLRLIRENKDNRLTDVNLLTIIKRELGLPKDKNILVERHFQAVA